MDVIQEVGSYAGFAAVIGLAVLSALYFSQGRDVRRLREWAGRAPERAAEQAAAQAVAPEQAAQEAARPAPSGAVRPIPAVKPAGPKPSEPGKAAEAAGPGEEGKPAEAKPGEPGKPPAVPTPAATPAGDKKAAPPGAPPVPATAAAAARPPTATGPAAPAPAGSAPSTPAAGPTPATPAGGPAPATPAAAPPKGKPDAPAKPPGPSARPPAVPARPAPVGRTPATAASSQSTAVLPASATRLRDRGRRGSGRDGLSPRYIALIVAGVIVIGGGVAFGISQLGGDDGKTSADRAQDAPPEPVNPSTVTVSVLNGTTVPGLAAQIGDEVEADGFQRGNVANALDQQRTTSVVLYSEGADREAKLVARKLGINAVEPIDPDSQALGGNASVVVIVGADQTS